MSLTPPAGGRERRVRVGWGALNLFWTLPLAFFLGWWPPALARFSRCGITECSSDPEGGFGSPSAPGAVVAALVAGVLVLLALGLTPWLRPLWLRWTCAAIGAAVLAAGYLWVILFARYL